MDLYVKPYTRCGPYIVGCLVGYLLLEKNKPSYKLSRTKVVFCWILFISLGLYSVFGLFYYTKTGEISNIWAITYTLVGRPSFALFLGWVVYACEAGYAGKVKALLSNVFRQDQLNLVPQDVHPTFQDYFLRLSYPSCPSSDILLK